MANLQPSKVTILPCFVNSPVVNKGKEEGAKAKGRKELVFKAGPGKNWSD
jgi:hypothetical protein